MLKSEQDILDLKQNDDKILNYTNENLENVRNVAD